MIVSHDDKQAVLKIFLDKLENQNRLIEENSSKPLEFLAKRGSYYPPPLERMFLDIYFGLVTRAAWVGPRGGGKTFTLGDLASCMFLFKFYDVLIGSGSEEQASKVYDRVMKILCDKEETAEYVPSMTTKVAKGKKENWIEFVPASQKRARGPHPGEGKRGGMIIVDEEAEMDEAILKALIGTGGTAQPLVIIRASTAHKVDGTFAELLDNPRGYTIYRWDVFDVCGKCERKCAECIEEFRDDYCQGKARKNSILGWVSLDYIFSMWEEMDKEWFEVELMGRRSSGAGLVVTPEDLKAALVDEAPFVQGAPNCAGMDWGFKGMAAAVATQLITPQGSPLNPPGGDLKNSGEARLQVFDRMAFHAKGIEVIIEAMLGWKKTYGISEVCADSSHPFENDSLRKAGFTVHEVTFVSFKDAGAGAVKGFFEKRRMDIPKRFKDMIEQLKHWRRGKDGKIVKKDDHFPDSLLCTMWKWWKKMRRVVGYTKITRG
jgi:hypothetical protein